MKRVVLLFQGVLLLQLCGHRCQTVAAETQHQQDPHRGLGQCLGWCRACWVCSPLCFYCPRTQRWYAFDLIVCLNSPLRTFTMVTVPSKPFMMTRMSSICLFTAMMMVTSFLEAVLLMRWVPLFVVTTTSWIHVQTNAFILDEVPAMAVL